MYFEEKKKRKKRKKQNKFSEKSYDNFELETVFRKENLINLFGKQCFMKVSHVKAFIWIYKILTENFPNIFIILRLE